MSIKSRMAFGCRNYLGRLRLLPWLPHAGLNEQLLQQAIGIMSRPKCTFSPLELKRVQDIQPWRSRDEAVARKVTVSNASRGTEREITIRTLPSQPLPGHRIFY